MEFRDPKLERSAGLTAADRKWMDDILTDVNENWSEDDAQHPTGMQQYDFFPISQSYPLNLSIDSKEATIICERRSVYLYSPFDMHGS